MRWSLVILACCAAPPRRAAPPPPPPTPEPPGEVRLPREANDDLPHRRAEAARLLAGAADCVPPRDAPDRDPITLALDAIGDQLVACAQLLTRRGVSVFSDPVSYACWTVDPETGHLARRPDLGRSYFRCQDGLCPPEARAFTSHDGTARVAFDERTASIVRIVERRPDGTAGAVTATFALPAELAAAALIGDDVTYLGHAIAVRLDDAMLVLDEQGRTLARLPGRPTDVVVVSPSELLLVAAPVRATLYDVGTRTATPIERPGCSDAELADEDARGPACTRALAAPITPAVRRRGKLYGIDDLSRRLIVVDATFRAQRTRSLAVCR